MFFMISFQLIKCKRQETPEPEWRDGEEEGDVEARARGQPVQWLLLFLALTS
uniref:Uncharacterized protein n=1 Tax=Myripristis murdjan TaxID=586833 RepID=A0A667ZDB3_9TELE